LATGRLKPFIPDEFKDQGVSMVFPSIEAILHPDGKLTLSGARLPTHPVRVLVTILESDSEEVAADLGDYLEQLTAYEERLARGEIQWQ
jgi:hypothetical protein